MMGSIPCYLDASAIPMRIVEALEKGVSG